MAAELAVVAAGSVEEELLWASAYSVERESANCWRSSASSTAEVEMMLERQVASLRILASDLFHQLYWVSAAVGAEQCCIAMAVQLASAVPTSPSS